MSDVPAHLTTPPVKALILDYGEVLSLPQRPESLEALARTLGVGTAAMADAYWRLRREYDCGLSYREYWRRTVESLGVPWDAALLDTLVAHDVAGWTHYREEMWDLAVRFRAAGGRTGFLSNGVPEIMARIREDRDLAAYFDAVVASCEVGLAKPDPAIYRLTLDRIEAPAGETLFVDDRDENIAAAAALGLQTMRFRGGESVVGVARALRLG